MKKKILLLLILLFFGGCGAPMPEEVYDSRSTYTPQKENNQQTER